LPEPLGTEHAENLPSFDVKGNVIDGDNRFFVPGFDRWHIIRCRQFKFCPKQALPKWRRRQVKVLGDVLDDERVFGIRQWPCEHLDLL